MRRTEPGFAAALMDSKNCRYPALVKNSDPMK
jgi:hypothetical protein